MIDAGIAIPFNPIPLAFISFCLIALRIVSFFLPLNPYMVNCSDINDRASCFNATPCSEEHVPLSIGHGLHKRFRFGRFPAYHILKSYAQILTYAFVSYVDRCIDIAVMFCSALWAFPFPYGQIPYRRIDRAAVRTLLR